MTSPPPSALITDQSAPVMIQFSPYTREKAIMTTEMAVTITLNQLLNRLSSSQPTKPVSLAGGGNDRLDPAAGSDATS